MSIHKVNFQVSLNDGRTLQEDKGILAEVDGKLSPWNILKEILSDSFTLRIVSLSLLTDDGQTYNLPSAGKNPNFGPFRQSEIPKSYRVERAKATESVRLDVADLDIKEWYTIAVAVYNEYELQIWVSELDPKHSWSLVIKK